MVASSCCIDFLFNNYLLKGTKNSSDILFHIIAVYMYKKSKKKNKEGIGSFFSFYT